MRVLAACLAILILGGGSAAGQGYERGGSQNEETRLRALTQSLQKMLDKGERERLADPWFLKDLRDLVDRYHRPWSRMLLSDDFSARNRRLRKPWNIVAGEFRLDWRHGLRSVVYPRRHRYSQERENRETNAPTTRSGSDPVQQLLGALMNQALQGGRRSETGTAEDERHRKRRRGPRAALIQAPIAISNAFAMELEVTSRALEGAAATRFAIHLYQGEEARAGYRLVFSLGGDGSKPAMRLLRGNPWGGTAMMDFAKSPIRLDPDRPSRIIWTRGLDSKMEVSIDGARMIKVIDRGFNDPFDGLAIVNREGDIAIRRIRIDGI